MVRSSVRAVLGRPEPTLLLLSAPAGDGNLHAAGATARLSRMAAREIGRLLEPTGETERRYPAARQGCLHPARWMRP